jgi:hypothetical protein
VVHARTCVAGDDVGPEALECHQACMVRLHGAASHRARVASSEGAGGSTGRFRTCRAERGVVGSSGTRSPS